MEESNDVRKTLQPEQNWFILRKESPDRFMPWWLPKNAMKMLIQAYICSECFDAMA